ncbi:PLDc N-terminal domain-containing protein [Planctomycetota bacterium]
MSIFGLFFILMFLVIGIGGTILWIWTIVDCATKEPSEGNDKIIWIIIIVFTHWIGSLIYILVRRSQRIQQYGK